MTNAFSSGSAGWTIASWKKANRLKSFGVSASVELPGLTASFGILSPHCSCTCCWNKRKVGWTVGRFFFYSACLMLVGAIIGNWWIPVGFVGWIPGLALGLAPFGWVLYRRSDRFRRFNLQLPDAVDLIARSLRAGHSLPSALVTVAEEIADPLGPEFRQCADEMTFGLPFREAMLNLFRRFPLQDLQFLIAAILVQKETGGNLAELLDKTAAVLRSRIQLQQKVKVYTAQGRMTGVILVSLPFASFILLNIVRPGYTAPLFETEVGRKMVYVTLVSMTLAPWL